VECFNEVVKSPPQASCPPQASLRSVKKEDVLPKITKIVKTQGVEKFVKIHRIEGIMRLMRTGIVRVIAVFPKRSSPVFGSCSAGPLGLGCSQKAVKHTYN